eukprot:365551-Chlamydomonas_euryale.AAC.2
MDFRGPMCATPWQSLLFVCAAFPQFDVPRIPIRPAATMHPSHAAAASCHRQTRSFAVLLADGAHGRHGTNARPHARLRRAACRWRTWRARHERAPACMPPQMYVRMCVDNRMHTRKQVLCGRMFAEVAIVSPGLDVHRGALHAQGIHFSIRLAAFIWLKCVRLHAPGCMHLAA